MDVICKISQLNDLFLTKICQDTVLSKSEKVDLDFDFQVANNTEAEMFSAASPHTDVTISSITKGGKRRIAQVSDTFLHQAN